MTELTAANEPAPGSSDDSETPEELSFDSLPLSQELRATLKDIGYERPTPVQLAVWDPATRGQDAVVQARTGTGKTASFGIPIVDRVVRRSAGEVQVLVLCPTRELALQVSAELERLSAKKKVAVVPVYGGAPMPRQIEALAQGAQVVVGTPGRVLDHIRRGTLKTDALRMLVLDESDEMLSMGFEKEMSAIMAALPTTRQTLLFSATVPPDVVRMAENKLRDPEFITLSGDHIGALSILHFVYMISTDKAGALVQIIESENPESAVVFCNTKDETERVASALQARGYSADWLNGDLPQSEREKVMTATREGRLRFLVATDVAARGIDISHLTHVICHDFPQDAETYVHRTGRTGRAGKTGTAISLVSPQDIGNLYLLRLTYKIRPVERALPSAGELQTRAEVDVIDALSMKYRDPSDADLALARRLLTHPDALPVIAGLLGTVMGTGDRAAASQARRERAPKPVVPYEGRTRGRGQRSQGPSSERASSERRSTDAGRADGPTEEPASAPRERRERPSAERAGADRGDGRAADRAAMDRAGGDRDDRRGRRTRREDGRRDDARREPRSEGTELGSAPNAASPAPIAAAPPPAAPAPSSERGEADPEDATTAGRGPGRQRASRRRRSTRDRTDDAGPGANGAPAARPAATQLSEWHPPEEEGDDRPILSPPPARPERRSDARVDGPTETVEVFVNIGRRDGARAQDFQRILVDEGKLSPSDVGKVRVRDRHAFVAVQRERLDAALAALNGARIGDREAIAEPAREKPARLDDDESASHD